MKLDMLQNLLASAEFRENLEPAAIKVKIREMTDVSVKSSELRDFIFLVSTDHSNRKARGGLLTRACRDSTEENGFKLRVGLDGRNSSLRILRSLQLKVELT